MIDIYATLGPACADIATLKEMLSAGMTGLRLNLNHGRLSDTRPLLLGVREAARFYGTDLQLLADLQGRSLRIGKLDAPLKLLEGDTVVLGEDGIPVPGCLFAPEIEPATIRLSDGTILLEVTKKRKTSYLCRVLQGGVLESRKGICAPGAEEALPALTQEDLIAISGMQAADIHAVMVPFVTEARQLLAVRKALDAQGCFDVKIWAKLENKEGLNAMREWLPYADMCVIARGDLGNSFPLETIPSLQKFIAAQCIRAKVPFLVATGLLRSLIYENRPSRADISDIFNAVSEGASGLMLTDETARGVRPALSVQYLSDTAKAAEQARDIDYYQINHFPFI